MSGPFLRKRKIVKSTETQEAIESFSPTPNMSRQDKIQTEMSRSPLTPLVNVRMATRGTRLLNLTNSGCHDLSSDDDFICQRGSLKKVKLSPTEMTPSRTSLRNLSTQPHQEQNVTMEEAAFATKSFYRDKSTPRKSNFSSPMTSFANTDKSCSVRLDTSKSKSSVSSSKFRRANIKRSLSTSSSLNSDSVLLMRSPSCSGRANKATPTRSTEPQTPELQTPTRKFFNCTSRKKFTTTILPFGEQKISTPSSFKKKRSLPVVKKRPKKRRVHGSSFSSPSPPSNSISIKANLISDVVTANTNPESVRDNMADPAEETTSEPHTLALDFDAVSRNAESQPTTVVSESSMLSVSDEAVDFFDIDFDLVDQTSSSRRSRLSSPICNSGIGSSKNSIVTEKIELKPQTPIRTSDQVELKSWLAESKIDARDGKEQLMIDAGQLNVGPTICQVCGMLYGKECSEDKAIHFKIHNKVIYNLRFQGWKKERVVKEYADGRVLQITSEDPKYVQRKVEEVMEVVNMTLGFHEKARPDSMSMQVYLFVSDKKIVGALIANNIKQAYRCLPRPDEKKPLACSETAEPADCGINRIWTLASHRRRGIATRLMKCMRERFFYGWVLSKDQLAFSDPTPDGQMFARSYMRSETFLVYK